MFPGSWLFSVLTRPVQYQGSREHSRKQRWEALTSTRVAPLNILRLSGLSGLSTSCFSVPPLPPELHFCVSLQPLPYPSLKPGTFLQREVRVLSSGKGSWIPTLPYEHMARVTGNKSILRLGGAEGLSLGDLGSATLTVGCRTSESLVPLTLGHQGWALPCGWWGSQNRLHREKEARLRDGGQFTNSNRALDSLLCEMQVSLHSGT